MWPYVMVVSDLLKKTSEACPTEAAAPPAAEVRPQRPTLTFTPVGWCRLTLSKLC